MSLPNCNLKEIIWQYCIALVLCSSVFLLLNCTHAGKKSLLLPDGSNKNHPWNGSDTMTYVEPAQAFVHTGTFARGGEPDMHRTIGYPFFLAIMMLCFGKYWLFAAYTCQIFVFALIFPASSCIAVFLFPNLEKKDGWLVFFLLAVSGIGLAYTGQIMTDQFFSSLLIAGLAFGLAAILKKSWSMTIFHIILVGYAAQVRPTLGLFFFADFFVFLYVLRIWKQQVTKKRIAIISCSILILALAGNGPAFRNYLNHGIFTQTDVLANAFAEYLAAPVLRKKGLNREYNESINKFKTIPTGEQVDSQEKFAFSVFKQYPIVTAQTILYHLIWNSFESHWENIFHVYDKYFFINKSYFSRLKESIKYMIIFYIYYFFIIFIYVNEVILSVKRKNIIFLLFSFFYSLPLFTSFIGGGGARMRIYLEPIVIATSINFVKNFLVNRNLIV
jgi:hypothetical protein